MTLTVRTRELGPSAMEVELGGRLDSVTSDQLEEALEPILANPPKSLRFDMAGVTYISSMGIGVIVRSLKIVKQGGGRLALMRLQPGVKKVFEIVAALPDMNVFASVEEADRYFDAIQRQITDPED